MKFDLVLWANSGDQIQNRTQHRTKRETKLNGKVNNKEEADPGRSR